MARRSKRKYNLLVAMLMAIYVALIVFEWPHVGKVPGIALRTVLAILPALPVVLVIALAAHEVLRSDELEQRTHMIALGIATGVVSAVSIVGGFLVMAHVWRIDGSVLTLVFPALGLVYGLSRNWLKWRYTGSLSWRDWFC